MGPSGPLLALALASTCLSRNAEGRLMGPTLRKSFKSSERGETRPSGTVTHKGESLSWGCFEQQSVLPTFTRDRFPFCHVLRDNGTLLYWNHNYSEPTRTAELTFGVVSRVALGGKGQPSWMALGLSSESAGMKGMDVAMFWKDGEKGAWLEDRWASDYRRPALDQNVTDGGDKVLSEWVLREDFPLAAFVFTMPASSCGDMSSCPEDVVVSRRASTFVSYSHGHAKDHRQDGRLVPRNHGPDRTAGTSLLLLTPREHWQALTKPVALPSDARSLMIAMPSVPLPSNATTTYYCMWVRPPSDRKYHIYSVKLAGDPAVQSLVMHHAILYGSFVSDSARTHPPLGKPYECKDSLQSDALGLPLIVASHGVLTSPSDQAYASANAALAFGADSHGHDLWMLEVHYENEGRHEGLVDSTGFEIVYSPTLRQHDAGTIVAGSPPSLPEYNITSSLAIPPHKPRHDQWELCPSDITRDMLTAPHPRRHVPGGNHTMADRGAAARVLYARLHMHTLGAGGEIRVEHNGNGTGEDVILRRDYYDFQNQQGLSFSQEDGLAPYVAPGDQVRVRCTFNSTTRAGVTRWGPAGDDEMCTGYLFVAPLPRGDFTCFDTDR